MIKIEDLINDLVKLHTIYPDSEVYFTVEHKEQTSEINLVCFNADEENNNIEVLFESC